MLSRLAQQMSLQQKKCKYILQITLLKAFKAANMLYLHTYYDCMHAFIET